LRPRRSLTPGVLVLGAICVVLIAIAVLALQRGRSSPVAENVNLRGSVPPAPFLAADFTLRDALTGEVVRMHEQRGRVVVLTFLESRCTAACPLIASHVGRALRRLDADQRSDVIALAISANPRDDSRASVRSFLRAHRATREIRYLNGPAPELRRVWRAYQVLSALESGDPDTHSAPVRIYGRDGRWLSTLHAGADLSVDNLLHDVSVALG
jgi:cytochrome oxidase Cu insertion factor (SCO1/SenC/PrrC family)